MAVVAVTQFCAIIPDKGDNKMRKLFIAVCMLFLVAGGAQAYVANLYVGGSSNSVPLTNNTSPGGGSFDPSTLNGVSLPWVYCIGLNTSITIPGTYDKTWVDNTTGMVYDNGFNGGSLGLNQVPNAGQVAWLLTQYATGGADQTHQVALQAAIWHVIESVDLKTTSSAWSLYDSYLTALGSNTADTSNFLWLSPAKTGVYNPGTTDLYHYQALIPPNPVPIPPAFWLMGSGFLGLIAIRRRFKK